MEQVINMFVSITNAVISTHQALFNMYKAVITAVGQFINLKDHVHLCLYKANICIESGVAFCIGYSLKHCQAILLRIGNLETNTDRKILGLKSRDKIILCCPI